MYKEPRTYLYERKRELNLSFFDLAELTDLSPRYLCRLFNGERGAHFPITSLEKMRIALDMSIEEIYTKELAYRNNIDEKKLHSPVFVKDK